MNDAMNHVLRKPIGVVGLISPWNLPLYLLTWKVAPALLMGNAIVAKPSEITPLTAHRFSELALEAGLPAGLLNVFPGSVQRSVKPSSNTRASRPFPSPVARQPDASSPQRGSDVQETQPRVGRQERHRHPR
ncbi:MAG: hypothetical protein CM15mP79_3060 [Methanobacteriota archaeon]|nr:MAG: hypothetical protein CM15mP79_3060 [Euryarchaeota archaeon]